MIKKIGKHIEIIQRRARNNATLEKMKEEENSTLSIVVSCLEKGTENRFSPEDHKAFQRVEHYRSELLASKEVVDYKVFGSEATAIIGDVCQKATSPAVWARLIYSLAQELKTKKVLEIGTNLGVSGSYLLEVLKQDPSALLVTMEGMPRYVEISGKQFASITSPSQFELVQGKYEDTFSEVINRHQDFDLLFIDGNHQKIPTIHYHDQLLSHSMHPSVWVFDDINWTSGMVEAWEIIKSHPQTAYSIDLYKLGLIIVDPNVKMAKHFKFHLSY